MHSKIDSLKKGPNKFALKTAIKTLNEIRLSVEEGLMVTNGH